MTEIYNTGNVSGSVPILNPTGNVNFFEKLMKVSEEKSLSYLSARLEDLIDDYTKIINNLNIYCF